MAENQEQDHENASDSKNQKHQSNRPISGKKTFLIRLVLVIFTVVIVIGGGIYWFLTRHDVSTDDAFTAGRSIMIAPHVKGYVTELLVNDNQFVHKGDILVKIDDRDYQAARDQAAAELDQAEGQYLASRYMLEVAKKNFPGRLKAAQGQLSDAQAQLFKSKTDFSRQHNIARPATTQQAIDYSTAAFNSAKAAVVQAEGNLLIATPVEANIGNASSQVDQRKGVLEEAKAKLRQAELNLEWTVIRAPHDGWISKRNVEQGNFVNVGQSLFSIVEPEVWVVANYKETQITHMRIGQKVKIEVDAYPFLDLEGHVDSLQLGTGAVFSAFPPENATGNYVKIVQRVPVKILIDKGLDPKIPLPLGLSVVPTVYTK